MHPAGITSSSSRTTGSPWERRSRTCYGQSLGDRCAELTTQDVVSLEENVESWGRVGSVVDDLAGRLHRRPDRGARVHTAAGPSEP